MQRRADTQSGADAETAIYQERAVAARFGVAPTDAVHRSSCVLVFGSTIFRLQEGENVIGRDSAAAVRLESPLVSRRHARVTIDGGRSFVEDLGSKNGTFVGHQRVEQPTEIADNAEIRIGHLWLIFQAAHDPSR